MGPTGAIVRKLDRLGRLVLPREMLHLMDISDGDPLEVLLDGDRIVLRKYQPGCIFCGKTEDLILHRDRKVCRDCVRTLAGSPQPADSDRCR